MRLLTLIFAVMLAATSYVSYADNYDSARKIMQADKEVRDYQSAKAGGYGYIYNDTSTGETVIKIVLLGVVVVLLGFMFSGYRFGRGKQLSQHQPLLVAIHKGEQKVKVEGKVKFSEIAIGDLFSNDSAMEKMQQICVKIAAGEAGVLAWTNRPLVCSKFGEGDIVSRVVLK